MQNGESIQHIMFGDSAYKRRSHLTSYAKTAEGVPLDAHFVMLGIMR